MLMSQPYWLTYPKGHRTPVQWHIIPRVIQIFNYVKFKLLIILIIIIIFK